MNLGTSIKCTWKSWCAFPDEHDDNCMPLSEIIAGNPLEMKTIMMLTDLFKSMTFDEVKQYSDIISDVNTFYAFRHIAMITNNAKEYAVQDDKYKEAIEKLKTILTAIYNKRK